MNFNTRAVCCLAAVFVSLAQTALGSVALVIPPTASGTEGSSYSGVLQGRIRLQEVYESSMFTNGPIRIQALRFRRDRSTGPVAPINLNLQLVLSTTTVAPDQLSAGFEQNLGPDAKTVFHATIDLASTNAVPAEGPVPFDIEIPLSTPFDYDPVTGNLLIQIRTFSGTQGLWTDQIALPGKVARCYSGDVDATVAGIVAPGEADPIEFVGEPISPTVETGVSVLPPAAETTEGNYASGILTWGIRMQDVYDHSILPSQSVRITGLRFRRDGTVNPLTPAVINVRIALSTTAKQVDGLSPTMDENLGTNTTWIFQGPLTVLSTNSSPPASSKPFDISIPCQTPFVYDPSEGNLLLEIRTSAGLGDLWTDAVSEGGDMASRQWSSNPNGTTADLVDSAADVVQLVYEILGPSTRILPPEMASKPGQWASGMLQTGWRTQNAYDKSLLPETPIDISALRFRRATNSAVVPAGTVNLRVRACATPKAPDSLSATLDQNLGANVIDVFQGDLTLVSTNSGAPGQPNPFELEIPFTTPFRYDPAQGHLLFEVRTYQGIPNLYVDDVLDENDKAQRVVVPGADGTVAPIVNSSVEVVQIVYRPTAVMSCTAPPPGLTAWWPGEAGVAEVIAAHAGNAHGSLGYTTGKAGLAFRFDGSEACVQVPYASDLNPTNLTVEGWIQPTSQVQDPQGQDLIFGQAFGAPQLVVRPGTNGVRVRFQFAEDAVSYPAVTTSEEIPLNTFSHVAGTWDGQWLKIYLNGVLKGQGQPNATPVASTNDFFIGGFVAAGPSAYNGQFFAGAIDELSLYQRALEPAELQALFEAGAGGKCMPKPPVIVQQPGDLSVVEGNTASFSVTVTGHEPLKYQWLFNSSPIPDVSDASLTLTNVTSTNAGSYSVIITNVAGSITSSVANLTVRLLPKITKQPVAVTAEVGSSAMLSVAATGSGTLAYRWYKMTGAVSGATAPILIFDNVQPSNAGTYFVRVSNSDGFVTSDVVTLSVFSGDLTATYSASGLKLDVVGYAGSSYAIEWTTDFVTWNQLATVLNTGTSWQFTDPTTDGAQARFYRLRRL